MLRTNYYFILHFSSSRIHSTRPYRSKSLFFLSSWLILRPSLLLFPDDLYLDKSGKSITNISTLVSLDCWSSEQDFESQACLLHRLSTTAMTRATRVVKSPKLWQDPFCRSNLKHRQRKTLFQTMTTTVGRFVSILVFLKDPRRRWKFAFAL